MVVTRIAALVAACSVISLPCSAQNAQTAPNVASVLLYSATFPALTIGPPSHQFSLNSSLADIYGEANPVNLPNGPNANLIFNPATYESLSPILRSATIIDQNIGTALSILPLPSPASGVVLRTDEATGAPLPVSSTLGPIFTERAETIGRRKFHIAVTHQDFHFTSFSGESLNGLNLLYTGGEQSHVSVNGQLQSTVPSTLSMGADMRLSQNVAFLTYGLTDRMDLSVALPMVHAAVASRMYDAIIYAGNGMGKPVCWCADTGLPGVPPDANNPGGLYRAIVGQSSLSKTGFGDLLFRLKGTVLERPGLAIALGSDLRLPTGDAKNFLGTGTTSVRPFAALSVYTKPIAHGIVFAPHLNMGWQFSGKSVLGGQITAAPQALTIAGSSLTYYGPPYVFNKGYLPDVFSWAVGSEVAFGSHNTFVLDVLGNQIGLINGIASGVNRDMGQQVSPIPPAYASVSVHGIAPGNPTSFGEYSGAFGYKAKLIGNLVATFNLLVRLDNNALVARAVPLYGLGYTF